MLMCVYGEYCTFEISEILITSSCIEGTTKKSQKSVGTCTCFFHRTADSKKTQKLKFYVFVSGSLLSVLNRDIINLHVQD